MKQRSRHSIALFMAAIMTLLSVVSASAVAPANPDFQRTWERTDKPVADLAVSRTWMWGPSANTGEIIEEYADSPGGTRKVQYFDKSRMEINNPDAPRGLWYVTNGLLVMEMITGRMQVGDALFQPRSPAMIPVAGDADDIGGPTYASLATVLKATPLAEGVEISWRIDNQGNVSLDNPLTGHGVTAAYYDAETKHTVASPFWQFMNSTGMVWENGKTVNAKLFENPFYATGRPITEAYWAIVKVGGTEQSVLLQCFERRCLTYTPRNADGWKVEAGNVGQHYHAWRYGDQQAQIFLVSPDDGGATGMPIGCNDSLVGITRDIDPHKDPVTGALEVLFAIKTRDFGESGLITALHNSNLQVDSVHYTSSTVTVALSGQFSVGGICDEPRFLEQVRQTVIAASGGAIHAFITINGVAIEDIFGQAQQPTANVYLISEGDGGPVGCGDSLAAMEVNIPGNVDPITGALTALFALDEGLIGEEQLYNSLHQSDLAVDSVSVANGHAVVHISGDILSAGSCDDPRLKEQIRATVLQFANVTSANIFVNGTPLDDLFDMSG